MPSDFLFLVILLFFALFPLSWKRLLAILLPVCIFAGVGALSLHLYTQNYTSVEAGECRLSGTVLSVAKKNGYSVVVLSDLALDGKETGGKCRIYLSTEEVLPADELVMSATVTPVDTENLSNDGYVQYLFSQNVRYTARASSFEITGRSNNPFLRLNAALYRTLYANMDGDEAGVAYALLTGNSGGMDEGILNVVQKGGIAHIFAVSGLHIGILYGAVYLVCRPMKKYRFLPALFAAATYCALCNFTVSSVRAALMCGVFGTVHALGKKYDFLESISLAAIVILLFSPAQWFGTGFRLTFGACTGLALFSDSFSRLFSRLKFPKIVNGYLSASLSATFFSVPVLLESFGYLSVWSVLLNLLILPLLPVIFLGLLLFALFALIIPPAAAFFLAFPESFLSLFLYIFSIIDPSFVLAGFALGAGGVVWWVACVALSSRFRLSLKGKGVAAAVLVCIFAVAVMYENIIFYGVRIDTYSYGERNAALVRTNSKAVLILDGEIKLSDCEEFLNRTYGGKLTAIIALSNGMSAVNTAAFLDTDVIYARTGIETGFHRTEVIFGEEFTCGALSFRYESGEKLVMLAQSLVVEFDFDGNSALGADLFIGGGRSGLKYFLKNGIISTV